MGTSAISHFRYDFDNYVVELQTITNRAAAFLIKDSVMRNEYLE